MSATQRRERRGTTSQHLAFAGAEGELTVDVSKYTAVIHDGSTMGGHPLAKEQHTHSVDDISGLGEAAYKDTGFGPEKVVVTDEFGRLPPMDATQLINLPIPSDVIRSTNNLSDVADASVALANLGGASSVHGHLAADIGDLGTAATKNIGTNPLNVIALDGNGKLPAVDGSALTNLSIPADVMRNGDNLSTVADPAIALANLGGMPSTYTPQAQDITGLHAVATTGSYSSLSGTPTLSTVATSGVYNDLLGKPSLSAVATSGNIGDLLDVDLTGLSTDNILKYNGTQWVASEDSYMVVDNIKNVAKLPQSASDPSNASAGDLYYNTVTNKMKLFNGVSWMALAFEAVSGPATDPYWNDVVFLLDSDGTDATGRHSPIKVGANLNQLLVGSTTNTNLYNGSIECPQSYQGTYYAVETTPHPDFTFDGDFTVEGWINPTGPNDTASFEDGVIAFGKYNNSNGLRISFDSDTNTLGVYTDIVYYGLSGSVSLNQWTHFALVRNGSDITLYLNGVGVATLSDTQIFNNAFCTIAGYDYGSSRTMGLYGFIEGIRITKGVARYVSDFSIPNSTFPTS